ncbi:MAG: hypothetical protein ABI054_03910 [Planctomycetota bacterium]
MGNEISTLELRQLQEGKRDFALINVFSERDFVRSKVKTGAGRSVPHPDEIRSSRR